MAEAYGDALACDLQNHTRRSRESLRGHPLTRAPTQVSTTVQMLQHHQDCCSQQLDRQKRFAVGAAALITAGTSLPPPPIASPQSAVMSRHATQLSQRKRKLVIYLPDDVVGILLVVKNPMNTLEIMERKGVLADLDKSRYPKRRMTLTGSQAGVYGAINVLLQAPKDLENHTITTTWRSS